MTEVGRGLDAIAGATDARRQTSRRVADSIDAIASGTRSNNQAVEQTCSSRRIAGGYSPGLQATVGRFKV